LTNGIDDEIRVEWLLHVSGSRVPFIISSRVSQHFFNGSVAGEDAAQAVLAQCYHSKLHSFLFQSNRWRALIDEFTNWISDFEKLVDSFSSLVASVVTGITPFAIKELFFANVLPRDP
jgi:hypothetical protein